MVLRREAIEQRLKELDEILQELAKYRETDRETLRRNLSQRWVVEGGLIAAASIILDFDNDPKGLVVFPAFVQEILAWLDAQVGD